MPSISGNCLCGSVTYESSAEPAMIAVCHCTDCQRQSGSPFSVNVLVPIGDLDIKGESLTQFTIQGHSGKPVTRHFCNKCGSPIATVMEHFGNLAAVKSGTLTDSSWVKPNVQIWCDSSRTWGVLDAELQKVPQNPPV